MSSSVMSSGGASSATGGTGGCVEPPGGSGGNCLLGQNECDHDCDGYLAMKCCGGTDCADEDANAHPEQTTPFAGPIKPPFTTKPYDFDCDGLEEPAISAVQCTGILCDLAQDQFLTLDGSPVQCGDTGLFGDCAVVPCGPTDTTPDYPQLCL
jgi:hypothetical protein